VSTVQGHDVYHLTPRRPAGPWHILYLHGGAWVNPLVWPHWAMIAELVRRTRSAVTVPMYPLAPEHTWRESWAFLDEVYRGVLAHTPADRIVVAGDSAGGSLAQGMVHHARAAALPRPGRLVLFAPGTDMTLSNPEMKALEAVDVMLRVDAIRVFCDWWAGGDDITLPLLSPLFGELGDFPPTQIHQGGHDILAPDARRLRDALVAAGVPVDWHETPGAFHVFMGATFAPESRQTFDRVARWLNTPLP
jgi:acetyl esterase/lipase